MLRTSSQVQLPVDLHEMASHAVTCDAGDLLQLSRMGRAATALVQTETARQFIDDEWTLTLDCFPSVIELRVCPVQSVTSVKYYDLDGVQQTLDSSAYLVDVASEPGRITPVPDTSWPDTQRRSNAVEVVFVAGYGTSVHKQPKAAQQAILLLAAHWFANREAVSPTSMTEVPLAVRSLINSLKWKW